VIDTDGICPPNCLKSVGEYDLLPLMRYMWKIPSLIQSLDVASTGRVSTDHATAIKDEIIKNGHAIVGEIERIEGAIWCNMACAKERAQSVITVY
jgi:hypothetical protein